MPKQFTINMKQFDNNTEAVHQQCQKQWFTGNAQSSRLLAIVSYEISIQALASSMALGLDISTVHQG